MDITNDIEFLDNIPDDAVEIEEELDLKEEIKCSDSYYEQLDEQRLLENLTSIALYDYGFGATETVKDVLSEIYYQLRSRKRVYRYMKAYYGIVKFFMIKNRIPINDFRYQLPLEKMSECLGNYKSFSDRLYKYFNDMLKNEKIGNVRNIYFIFINLNALLDFCANYFDYIADIINKQNEGEYKAVPSDIIMQNNINMRKIEDQLKVLGI